MPNVVIVQSGGPTAVINASLVGAVAEARRSPAVSGVLGARFGAAGLLSDEFVDLYAQPAALLEQVARAPGSALGSSRRVLRDDDYGRMLGVLRRREVRWLLYAGGNGSMETALKIAQAAESERYELCVAGIPKTIDNDLTGTNHCPGYPSAARFFAHAVREIGEDNRSLPAPVTVIEVIGRNAGWVAAGTSLARYREDDAPHLIYLPERLLSPERLLMDVETVYRRLGRAVVVACEGQRDDKGEFFGAELVTAGESRHRLAGNLGHMLSRLIAGGLGIRARFEKPGLLGRSCSAFVPETDREDARRCGEHAMRLALAGESNYMAAITAGRQMTAVPLDRVAGRERTLPESWIASGGNDVTEAFRKYAAPLAGPIEPLPRLII